MILDERIQAGEIVVLDGGTGSEIERLGGDMDAAAWCGVANKTHPDIVRRVHESYLGAGVDVITTNTFATCRHVLAAAGLGDEAPAITRRAVELCQEARKHAASNRPVAIAGSMSNNVAWEPGTFGSDPKFTPTADEEAANYREMADTLAEAGCDLLILEMMMDVEHASRLMEAALRTGLPVWAGISASIAPGSDSSRPEMVGWDIAREEHGNLPDDYSQSPREMPLATIVEALCALGPQVAGIMHSSFKSMTPGLDVLRARWDGPVMAYPEANGFDAETHGRIDVGPAAFAAHCRRWVDSGVQIIGGCCGTTVDHIRAMVEALPAGKHA